MLRIFNPAGGIKMVGGEHFGYEYIILSEDINKFALRETPYNLRVPASPILLFQVDKKNLL